MEDNELKMEIAELQQGLIYHRQIYNGYHELWCKSLFMFDYAVYNPELKQFNIFDRGKAFFDQTIDISNRPTFREEDAGEIRLATKDEQMIFLNAFKETILRLERQRTEYIDKIKDHERKENRLFIALIITFLSLLITTLIHYL